MASTAPKASPEEFLHGAETQLLELSTEANRAEWVFSTYITRDTEALSVQAEARFMSRATDLAKRSQAFWDDALSPVPARKIRLLRLSLPLVAPDDPREAEELARRTNAMSSTYSRGRYAPRGSSEPLDLQALSRILEESRDPAVLEDVWTGWHRVGREVRPDFERYVELANRGARGLGFPDLGAMWRSRYDMDAEQFRHEADRLWRSVRPLYLSLHAYVRRRLAEQYGAGRVSESGPIPNHLLGNMWAQSWDAIYPLLAPRSVASPYDLTTILRERHTTPVEMVRYGEQFFASLGFPPLPATFWERSMLVRPPGREVVCHASAWDVDSVDDVRLKMCLEITGEDFYTVHHELGHNYYQLAYARQPYLFRDSAHDGFHEAIGDTVALSITPDYLTKIGLLSEAPSDSDDIPFLLHRALEKVAFLPFGLLIDEWRWKVFAGEVDASEYNGSWWRLRREIQGVAPPAVRGEGEFDPGAKYHVSANVPYMRYFLSHILQFQFHRALARTAGASGPLHRASIYGSPAAGERLRATLEMGTSREWPDALETLTGDRRMDAAGLLEYFAPLQRWLDEQNRGATIGW